MLGYFIASSSDIEYLLNLTQHVSKEQHLLKKSDLNHNDKMNYGAVKLNTATKSAAKTSSLSRTTSISENRAEYNELLDEETEDCDSYDYQVLNSLSRSRFKDFSSLSPAQNLEETSFVRIFYSHNQPVVAKKSSVLWF